MNGVDTMELEISVEDLLNKRKKTWEMYPIGSPKGALNTKRKPEFIGVLKFKEDEEGSISINRFVIKDEKEDKLYPPSKAINILRSQAVFLAEKDDKLEAFLKQNNIKVRFTNICQHCSFEGEVTIINSDFSYLYHDQLICKTCAENTIKRELQLRGYDKKVFRNFKRVLEKTGSLDDVLAVTSSMEVLRKPIGSDEKNHKVTYVTLVGLEKAQEEVERLSNEAIGLVEQLPVKSEFLKETILYLIHREK